MIRLRPGRVGTFGRLVLVGLLAGMSASAAAATRDGTLSGYAFTSWTEWAGRPLGSVYAIAQTQDGYLWIGTDTGLLRFDGWRFLPWDTLSDTPLTGSVTTLTVARSGGLWLGVASPAGVARARDGKLQRYDRGLDGLDGVTALVEDSRGAIWAIADCELYSWNNNAWRKVVLPWKSRPGQVRHVFVSSDDSVWVGSRWGVFRKLADATDFQLNPEGIAGVALLQFSFALAAAVWVVVAVVAIRGHWRLPRQLVQRGAA